MRISLMPLSKRPIVLPKQVSYGNTVGYRLPIAAAMENRKHARLNTQRKILAVMYTIWKKRVAYRAELFAASA